MIKVRILCCKPNLRYSVRRIVESARCSLLAEYPDLQIDISEIRDSDEILKVTQILVAPVLEINGKVVYQLWIPKKEQVIYWIRAALQEQAGTLDREEAGRAPR